eukprot:TRINITY_DN4468_c0_g1_i1.p1 TRINITY_DN4468_c0_g1~~TRINITY_DN4468_c0_g1_i1.p1  ORF type:complete len:753 (+),score=169.94 TRINITY_DN4468_c0_g1_i1:330-2261(+)
MGGLEERPVDEIAARVVELGFNCIRLPVSVQASLENKVVEDQFVAANPQLKGKPFMDVLDATIDAMTRAGIMVIFDVHVLAKGWCCFPHQDEGLWYKPGFSEKTWIDYLYNMTLHYKSRPMVVGISIKNEVHDYAPTGTYLTWGDGNPKTDWHLAATKAGNRILEANPDMLVVVMGIFSGVVLMPVKDLPVKLNIPDRVVYETHNYVEEAIISNVIVRLIDGLFDAPHSIWNITTTVMFCLCLVLAGLLFQWRQLGAPRPPLPKVLKPVGWWIFGTGVFHCAFVLLWFFLFSHQFGANWPAYHIALPTLYRPNTSGLCVLGGAIVLASWYLSTFHPSTGNPRSPMLLASEDYTESDSDDGPDGKEAVRPSRNAMPRQLLLSLVAVAMLILQCLHLLSSYNMWMSYEWAASWFDAYFGFILEEGQDYTAPVWMGEFGYANEGIYWQHFLHYLADNDVDFAYWALNGKKYGEGYINDKTASFIFWAGCDTDVRPMRGTDCSAELGDWGYAGRDDIYDVMHFDYRPNACVYQVKTRGTCDKYCKSIGRECLKASASQGTCQRSPSADNAAEANGCLAPLDEQICVCTRQLWVWDNETFGLLGHDYRTEQEAWRIRDLQALAESPAKWYPKTVGCKRDYNGHVCLGN